MPMSSEPQHFSAEKGAMIAQGKCEHSGRVPEGPTHIALGFETRKAEGPTTLTQEVHNGPNASPTKERHTCPHPRKWHQ